MLIPALPGVLTSSKVWDLETSRSMMLELCPELLSPSPKNPHHILKLSIQPSHKPALHIIVFCAKEIETKQLISVCTEQCWENG